MLKMEQIIKKNGREQFYDYYISLGYDHKTAASLALFTYEYYNVPTFEYIDFINSQSLGRYVQDGLTLKYNYNPVNNR